MADISDVENALVTLIAQTLYPNGTGQPSVPGVPCVVYPGWPAPAQLDSDLKIGKSHVSVFPTPSERNTTRYPKAWQTLSVGAPTLTLAVSGQQITVGGTVSTPCNLSLVISGQPDYVYAVQPADTLTSIATALAALISANFAGTSSAGPVVTLPVSAHINAARVGISGNSIQELKRQERVIQITIWSDTSAHRDAVAGPVDIALATNQFITLPDTTKAKIIYKSSPVTDNNQKLNLYRRDLLYLVEYATTQVAVNPQIVAVVANISNQPTGATAPISTFTINQ